MGPLIAPHATFTPGSPIYIDRFMLMFKKMLSMRPNVKEG